MTHRMEPYTPKKYHNPPPLSKKTKTAPVPKAAPAPKSNPPYKGLAPKGGGRAQEPNDPLFGGGGPSPLPHGGGGGHHSR